MSRFFLIFLLMSLFTPVHSAYSGPSRPFPQHTVYAPNTTKPNHRPQTQLDDDVRAFYSHWKESYLVSVPGIPVKYRVSMGISDPGRTVSEGQGYGMIIVVLMAGHEQNAQAIYNGLWHFVQAHPSKQDNRLMAWESPEDPGGESSAFDGDADVAYSLLLADIQWGSDGAVNYLAEAKETISAIKESTIGPDSYLPLLGDWVNPNGASYNQHTPRSSDFMPEHFLSFRDATGDTFWDKTYNAVQSSITHMQNTYSPTTGLLPDFLQPVSSTDNTLRPANPNFLEGANDGAYYYNAGRVPLRIGINALLNNDSVSMEQIRRIGDWVAASTARNPAMIKAGYSLDGTTMLGNYFTTFFAAPFGVALMTRPNEQQFLNKVYDAVYATHEDYFEDSVTQLCLLVMSGNYWSLGIENKFPWAMFLPAITGRK